MEPDDARGWRTRLGDLFDQVVLALAVAGTSENGEALDAEYAEAMVLVFDEYFRLRTQVYPRRACHKTLLSDRSDAMLGADELRASE